MSGIATREKAQDLRRLIQQRQDRRELERRKPALTRFWDGDITLRGEVHGERAGEFEFIENDTGMAMLQMPLDHHLSKWVMNHRGRAKRNVHVSFDKQGARWFGRMDGYKVVRTKEGDRYLEITFKHDIEELKHILVWCNPFLRPEVQFPKLWVIFGPAKWACLLTLFVNIMRLETSIWTLPDNPLDPTEWFPLSLDFTNWRNIVKPFPLVLDDTDLVLIFSRFKDYFSVVKDTLDRAQLTITVRRYFPDEDEHPFKDLSGIWGLLPEELTTEIPLRHGVAVWDIVDNSGWGEGTAFGGSWLTGFLRAAARILSDGTLEGVDVFTGNYTDPEEYYRPGWRGTRPVAPWIVFEEGFHTGIESSEFEYLEATDTSFIAGGESMPGVNEGISAVINIGGDFLTSFINTQIAAAPFAAAAGAAIDLPPLGGLMDAALKPLYENVFLAFQETPTLRAAGLSLPIARLEDVITGLGDFHYYEARAGANMKAFTVGSFLATITEMEKTKARHSHKLTVSDAAPYYFGEAPYGHYMVGSRVATSVLGYPVPDTLFVERLKKAKWAWDKDGPKGWKLEIGYREPENPVIKLFELVREVNGVLGDVGVL
jgi:hypothetical protein